MNPPADGKFRGPRQVILYASAIRDEGGFEKPDALDIERDLGRTLSLRRDIHVCLGARVARVAGCAALEEFSGASRTT